MWAQAELKAQVEPEATLDDVFAHFIGVEIQPGGGYAQAQRARQSIAEKALMSTISDYGWQIFAVSDAKVATFVVLVVIAARPLPKNGE